VPVHPGDIVVADAEGIVVIPWQDAEDVYSAWREAAQADAAAGQQYAGARIQRLLGEIECQIVE
jgi:regulator of RNase E activity RraA